MGERRGGNLEVVVQGRLDVERGGEKQAGSPEHASEDVTGNTRGGEGGKTQA